MRKNPPSTNSRRDFLKHAGGTVAAAAPRRRPFPAPGSRRSQS